MNSQQLILIILGCFIIGGAIAVGISAFESGKENTIYYVSSIEIVGASGGRAFYTIHTSQGNNAKFEAIKVDISYNSVAETPQATFKNGRVKLIFRDIEQKNKYATVVQTE
ncbi:hypothetical protein HY967_02795 [Candidatus Jorgensenbacteria bacterium]|nr:hypothetical protein [Candidatus Jorgensenbacteria bacterium]